jgi:hypothetical protein
VRINPNEVHIKDPDFYDKIYFIGSKFPRDKRYYGALGGAENIISATTIAAHKRHRDVINTFFARRNILRVEPVVQNEVEKFCGSMKQYHGGGAAPMDLRVSTRALALDVIADMCFDTKYDAIQQKELAAAFIKISEVTSYFWALNLYLPGKTVATALVECLPTWLLEKLEPGVNASEKWKRVSLGINLLAPGLRLQCLELIRCVKHCDFEVSKIIAMPADELRKSHSHRLTIFKDILLPENKALEVMSRQDLAAQAFVLMSAGVEVRF